MFVVLHSVVVDDVVVEAFDLTERSRVEMRDVLRELFVVDLVQLSEQVYFFLRPGPRFLSLLCVCLLRVEIH